MASSLQKEMALVFGTSLLHRRQTTICNPKIMASHSLLHQPQNEDAIDISHPPTQNKTTVLYCSFHHQKTQASKLMDQKTVAPSLETLQNDELQYTIFKLAGSLVKLLFSSWHEVHMTFARHQ